MATTLSAPAPVRAPTGARWSWSLVPPAVATVLALMAIALRWRGSDLPAHFFRVALVELAPQLVRLVAPGGWLAGSGISPSQCSLVAGCLGPLVEVDRRASGDWSALVLAPP